MTQFILFFLVGLFFAWVFKSYRRYEEVTYSKETFQNFTLTEEHLRQSELGLFVALTAKVAKADGQVDKLEAELIGNMFTDISAVFPQPERTREMLKSIFNIEKEITYNLDDIAVTLYQQIAHDKHKRHMMMSFLVNLGFVDGHLSQAEEHMLLKIGAFLHFSHKEIETMFQQASSMYRHATSDTSLNDAYTLLESTPEDSLESIKKRYRKLVRQYHPDIIKAQGADDSYIAEATEKVQQINAAYEMIKKAKG